MERFWYYARKGAEEKAGPISTPELRELVLAGQMQREDVVWSEGMTDWQPLGNFPELLPPEPPPAFTPPTLPPPAVQPAPMVPLPAGLRGWMSFVGVMTLLSGIVSCMGCVSIITGVLMIMAGVGLLGARKALDEIPTIDRALWPFFDKLQTFFLMSGWVCILTILLAALMFFLFFSAIIGGIATALNSGV